MADISKIQLSDDTQYNLKDAVARSLLTENDTSTGDISKIQLSDNTQYNIKDAQARQDIETVTTDVKAQVNADKDLINGGTAFIDDETLDDYDDKIEEMQEAYKKFIPIQTASGTEIQLDNSSNDKVLTNIGLDGNTEQFTTTGKNKFDGLFRQGVAGSTEIYTRLFSTNGVQVTANQSYTFSSNLNTSTYSYAFVLSATAYPSSTVTSLTSWLTDASYTITPTSGGYLGITIRKGNGADSITLSEVDGLKFQMETGSTATTYEPYTGRNSLT